jgi:hypothetical protein
MEPAHIDPFAVALSYAYGGAMTYKLEAGVGAKVQKVFLCLTRCRTASAKDEREC